MHDIASEFSYPKKIHNGIFLTIDFFSFAPFQFSIICLKAHFAVRSKDHQNQIHAGLSNKL